MDEARAVVDRLRRIEALERVDAPAGALLAEVRALLGEAEAWMRSEGSAARMAEAALARCREAVAAGEERVAGAPASREAGAVAS
jgi:hypothetical protein